MFSSSKRDVIRRSVLYLYTLDVVIGEAVTASSVVGIVGSWVEPAMDSVVEIVPAAPSIS